MSRLEQTLESYLERTGRLKPVQLGEPDREPTRDLEPDSDVLFGRLYQQTRSHTLLLGLLIATLCFVLIIGVTVALLRSHSLTTAGGLVLAMLLALVWIVRELGRIQSERAAMGVIIYGIRNSPLEEVPRLVEMVYWNQHQRSPGFGLFRPRGPVSTFIFSTAGTQVPRYDDFVLRIQPGPNSTLTLLAACPSGKSKETLNLDPDVFRQADELAVVTEQRRQRGLLTRVRHLLPGTPVPAVDATELGQRLFKALFPETVRRLYDRNLGRLETSADHGVRIRLELDPRDRQLTRLNALPWELLCRPPEKQPLGIRRLRPFVRSPDARKPLDPIPLPPPLRILMAISSPTGLPRLNLERERRQIEAAWKDHPAVEVVWLERANLSSLREALLAGTFHVLHFMGHGDIDPQSGAGVLFFEAAGGGKQTVPGPLLAGGLEDFARSLRLVVLNACHSAHPRQVIAEAEPDPLTGVAASLVESGLTSVVAMQFAVSDPAAIGFSRTLYRRLAAGDPIDTAVTEGRRTLVRMDPDSLEWATPVLFMRAGDGRLIERPELG